MILRIMTEMEPLIFQQFLIITDKKGIFIIFALMSRLLLTLDTIDILYFTFHSLCRKKILSKDLEILF